ncbi:YppE family protein [Bacillus massilinigeriensis]|uniref:YppE family protein n=1 Tax=Bacillus mediterraneensis TaxID=1805474 RepID=UPI0008F7F8CE|nr:YppE family protein [Bacillus mediterraneensis]
MDKEDLFISLTFTLRKHVETAAKQYERAREEGQQGDFYNEVKPFADEVKECSNQWQGFAVEWIGKNKPKYLHMKQIEATLENLEIISVQAFYPETGKKRFVDRIQSVYHVLDYILALTKAKENK